MIHFISGLPRSGSTLVAAILRQNPGIHAAMTSPVGGLFSALLRQMSAENETSVFVDDARRTAVLRGLFASYFEWEKHQIVFDTNRLWCSKMPALATLFPRAKVIACVRHVPWIFDSVERLVRANPLQTSKIFNFDAGGTVYSRCDGLNAPGGMVGFAWNAMREAFFSEQSSRLMLLQYETLTANPKRAMAAVYDFIGEVEFAHDFDNVCYDAAEFDARIGMPGLHRVGKSVRVAERKTILPPDLFRKHEVNSFWRVPEQNINSVRIV
jgi:sulfotransferase